MLAKQQTYKNKTIHLDGGTYVACSFVQCHLVYSAALPVVLDSCSFDNCTYGFGGATTVAVSFIQAPQRDADPGSGGHLR